MALPSVKHNFFFNLINTLIKIVFPLIVFPYVSRILLPEGIGRVNYAEAFVSYFVLFSSLGIPVYGLREVAKHRNDLPALQKKLAGVFSINIVFAIISYSILAFLVFFNFIGKEPQLILINSSLILFSLLDMEWYFQGTENYKFITIRNVILKMISLVLIFIFIRSNDDVLLYAALLAIGVGGNSLFNFSYVLSKHGKALLKHFNLKFIISSFSEHLRSILITSSMALAGSIYLSLDVVMLGQISSNEEVGFYSASIKIVRVLISVVLALSTVLLPRASLHVKNDEMKQFNDLIKLSFNFICFLSFPCIAGIVILSDSIIVLFSGMNFYPAHQVIELLAILMFLVSMNNLFGMQILYPLNKERLFLIAILIGAAVNVISNLILIPHYNAIGAAISSVLAEFFIFITLFIVNRKFFEAATFKKPLRYILATVIMCAVVMTLNHFIPPFKLLNTAAMILTGGLCYVITLVLLKETDFIKPILVSISSRLKSNG
ncbi:MAG: flippase [Bacteroidia bacterium]|nr:flippase [Bacteroidia bacterium]